MSNGNNSSASSVVLRYAHSGDQPGLRRLAARDSAGVPAGQLIVAEVDGEIRAAYALEGGALIADPFHPTAHLVAMLRTHALPRGDGGTRPGRLPGTIARRAPWPA